MNIPKKTKSIGACTKDNINKSVKTEKMSTFFLDGNSLYDHFTETYKNRDVVFFEKNKKVLIGKLLKRNPKTIRVELANGDVVRVSLEKVVYDIKKMCV
jgi:hypothetical protein